LGHVSYRVFARKYRPRTFTEVVGQDHITRTLRNAVANDRLAQAYLFVGPRGIGKTSTARILAKALNCAKGVTIDPCGTCPACTEIAEGRSLDVIEIDGASNNSVENIRDLRDNAAYAPTRGKYKIYLIDEVHMLTTGAFNALLKTLEEPPGHVKFIFATTEAHKVPATITSRCQRFDLRRIPDDLIAGHLLHIAGLEGITLEKEAADAIAHGAEGGLRDAESMLDQMAAFCGQQITTADVMEVFGFTPREVVERLAEGIFQGDAQGVLRIVSEQSDAGKDLSRLTGELAGHLRDQLVRQAVGEEGAVRQDKLLDLIEHFSAAEASMRWATDKKLQIDVAVIKALHLLDETSLTDVIETLSGLRDGSVPAPQSPPPARTPAPRPQPAKAAEPAKAAKPEEPEKPEKPAPAKSQPAKPAVAEAAPAEQPTDTSPAAVLGSVLHAVADTSEIRYGWLREGVFKGIDGGKVAIGFPSSSRDAMDSPFIDEAVSGIRTKLAAALEGVREVAFEFNEAPAAAVDEAPPVQDEVAEEEEEPAETPAAPPEDPMKDFMDDPLIEKALEKFKSTLHTPAA
jgi:DNA polymerase III subunit gamma/tau